jgi:hypothetical protein
LGGFCDGGLIKQLIKQLNRMIESVKIWLANYLKVPINKIEKIGEPNVAGFLIVWTIFEQNSFEGFLKPKAIIPFAQKHAEVLSPLINQYAEYFHQRYQDPKKYKNLKHEDANAEIDNVLVKSYVNLTDYEKVLLTLYIVYRYRNNIFHGNKGVMSWLKYKNQIEMCVNVMTIIIDKELINDFKK